MRYFLLKIHVKHIQEKTTDIDISNYKYQNKFRVFHLMKLSLDFIFAISMASLTLIKEWRLSLSIGFLTFIQTDILFLPCSKYSFIFSCVSICNVLHGCPETSMILHVKAVSIGMELFKMLPDKKKRFHYVKLNIDYKNLSYMHIPLIRIYEKFYMSALAGIINV